MRTMKGLSISAAISGVFSMCLVAKADFGTGFTYQGVLTQSGTPVNGAQNFVFRLWTLPAGGVVVGTQNEPALVVIDGLFEVKLDFGVSTGLQGDTRWLEIEVNGNTLLPRQELTPAAYAVQTRGIYVNSALNVGLGTTSPLDKLHLQGTNQRISIESTAGTFAGTRGFLGGSEVFYGLCDFVALGPRWEVFDNPSQIPLLTVVPTSGNVGIDNTDPELRLHILGGTDVSPTGGGYIQTGDSTGLNVAIDDNEIMGRNNGAVSNLFLNADGGNILLAANAAVPRVAIGTNTPIDMLHLQGTNPRITTEATAGSFSGVRNLLNTAEFFTGACAVGTLRWEVFDNTTNTTCISVLPTSCFVGMGLTTPIFPLHMASGAHVTAGGVWTNASSVDLKENFGSVDARDILARVVELPITQWNYRAEDDDIRHLGPTAEDFAGAFGLGHDDKAIGTVDADGVALAAIQGLYEIVQEKDEEIQRLNARLAALESIVKQLASPQAGGAE